MKKIYSFLSVMVLSLFAISANAQRTVIINVDDPERVDIRVNYTSVEGIVAGDNAVEIPQYGSFYAYAKSGCALESVRCTTTGTNYHIDNMTQAYVYVDASVEGDLKYEVKSNTLEALRTATMTVNVDDASQVSAVLSTTNERVSLVNGENTVKFIPGVESPIMIAHSTYGKVLYQVSVDDVIQEAQGQQYRLNVVDGSKVDIKANFPEGLAYRVQFSYVNEGTEDAVSSVTVDGAPIEAEKYNDPDFTVPAGKQVSVTFNLQDYQINSFKVNGTTTQTYGSYQFIPTAETLLEIDATKFAEFNSTLNIDHAENVTVYKGYSYNNNVISVTDGENILTMMSNSNMIAIKANSGCKIESITDNLGSSFSSDYNGCYNIYLSEGQVVTVTTSAIVRNDVVTINVDADPTDQNVISYFSFARADRSAITLNEGDNEVKFSSVDNPFGLSWYDSRGYTTAYLNGVKIKPYYEGGNSYELNFTNGDVLDVFIITEFTPLNVTFTNNDESVAANTTVSVDGKGAAIDYWANGLTVLSGTTLSIAPAGDAPIYVMNGEKVLTPEADGSYKVTVTEATALTLSSTSLTGIEEVAANAAADKNAVYNLQGVKVANRADALRNLPAGVYVVGGKKVMK